jgi:hypothetical protein
MQRSQDFSCCGHRHACIADAVAKFPNSPRGGLGELPGGNAKLGVQDMIFDVTLITPTQGKQDHPPFCGLTPPFHPHSPAPAGAHADIGGFFISSAINEVFRLFRPAIVSDGSGIEKMTTTPGRHAS